MVGGEDKDKGYDVPVLIATGWGLISWICLLTDNAMPVSSFLTNENNDLLNMVGVLAMVAEMLAMGWCIIAIPTIFLKGLSGFKK